LAYYRAGEWQQAILPLNEAARDWQHGKLPVEKQQAELVLAMCEYRLGQTDQANQRLKRACEMLDQTIPYAPDDPFAVYPGNWILLNILRREAEALMNPQKGAESQAGSNP
jgi:tetratricopeptide (TPR) repeat protein